MQAEFLPNLKPKIAIIISETASDIVVQQHHIVATNYEFLQSAGLLEDLLAFLNDAKKNKNKALQDITKSIDSLAHNISEKMASFGKRLEVLEISWVPEAPTNWRHPLDTCVGGTKPYPRNNSTHVVRNRGTRSTNVKSQSIPWADQPLTEMSDYCTSSKNSALLIIRHSLLNGWK